MYTNKWMTRFLSILGTSLVGLTFSTVAYAANPEPAAVNVEFVAPITIAKTGDLEFGLIDLNMVSPETIVIAPDSGLTDAASRVMGGTQAAATFNTQAAALKLITILITSPLAGANYTLGTWQCDYNLGADGDCGAGMTETTVAGPGIVVRVGVTLTGGGPAPAAPDNGSFSLSILYQ